MIPLLFGTTLFLSSFLLFAVQPLVGKWLLPLLGGVPSVWNTCLFFFQLSLLLGYAYSHLSAVRLGTKGQLGLHAAVVAIPFFTLPFNIPASVPEGVGPLGWLTATLSSTVGPAFLALATSAPLLQRWFLRTGHPLSVNPYPLYAASNAGSLIGLLAYPFLWEPLWSLNEQARVWAWGYGLWALLVAISGAVSLSGQGPKAAAPSLRPDWPRWARWTVLAFLPSCLLMGVTTYLSTEIGSIPLLWVIPLSLYLLSFILVFSDRWPRLYEQASRWYGLFALPLLVLAVIESTEIPGMLVPLHLANFFLAAILCHGALAKERPEPRDLTGFYLCLAVGGALAGVLNAIVFPVLFSRIVEYPLFVWMVCLFRAPFAGRDRERPGKDAAWGLVAGGMAMAIVMLVRGDILPLGRLTTIAALGIPALLCYSFVSRRWRFAVALGSLTLAGAAMPSLVGKPVEVVRNFFGVSRVTRDPESPWLHFMHGNTLHGKQWLDPAKSREPLLYFSRRGPFGHLVEAFRDRQRMGQIGSSRIAVIGLGAGTMACYAEPGDDWVFFEIDPEVIRIAREHFTFLSQCTPQARLVVGDARLEIGREPDGSFGLIVMDALTSSAIPIHLITKEALALYERKLAPGGLLAVHISNRHLDLKPVLGTLARHLGLVARYRYDSSLSDQDIREGRATTQWVVLARTDSELGVIEEDDRWSPPPRGGRDTLWTDAYSNLLSILKW